MAAPRYLCSQLMRLTVNDQTQWVNLEEIWDAGALLECEEAVDKGVFAQISAGQVTFSGWVTGVEKHEFGWRVEMAFSTPWDIEIWKPEHALDPAKLAENST